MRSIETMLNMLRSINS